MATDTAGRDFGGSRYSAREQRDGSWILRFDADWLQKESAHLSTRAADAPEEPLGCVTAAVTPPPG